MAVDKHVCVKAWSEGQSVSFIYIWKNCAAGFNKSLYARMYMLQKLVVKKKKKKLLLVHYCTHKTVIQCMLCFSFSI